MSLARPRVLFVDDEEFVLSAVRRSLRDKFELVTCAAPQEALQLLDGIPPVDVIVSDMRMPEMDGAEFLAAVRDRHPDSVRVLLTGYSDTNSAIDAINKGAIFRYLCKPWDREELVDTIEAAVQQQRTAHAERELLETTLAASVRTMSDLLAIAAPVAHRRAAFAQACVRHAMTQLRWADSWIYEVSAALSQIGCVGVPQATLDAYVAGRPLSTEDRAYMALHPERGFALLSSIPRLGAVADIVRYQNTQAPAGSSGEVVRGVELLRAALYLEAQWSRDAAGRGVRLVLREAEPSIDPVIIDALAGFRARFSELRAATIDELKPGFVVDEDIRSEQGALILAKGHELTATAVQTLRRLHACGAIDEPVYVRCAVEHTTH